MELSLTLDIPRITHLTYTRGINPHPKTIIEEDHKGQVGSVHVPKLQKLVKLCAVHDFPPGCGRYASLVAPESYISLPQRCLILPVSTSGDYSFGYGKNVSLMINKQCLLASAPNCHSNGVKDSSRQLFKLNFHSLAKESVKSRAKFKPRD